MKKPLDSEKSGSAARKENLPDSKSGEGVCNGFDELQKLLPMEENRLFIIEEKYLIHDASRMIKMQKDLFRMFSGNANSRTAKKTRAGKNQPKLTNSINPENLKKRLISMIEEEELYLDEEITLASLAYLLDVEPHQLTLFLNQYMDTNFRDFINSYRIEAAKIQIEKEPAESILAIAFRTGFNSKASFNRIFKKVAGQTPSQYRKSSSQHKLS